MLLRLPSERGWRRADLFAEHAAEVVRVGKAALVGDLLDRQRAVPQVVRRILQADLPKAVDRGNAELALVDAVELRYGNVDAPGNAPGGQVVVDVSLHIAF